MSSDVDPHPGYPRDLGGGSQAAPQFTRCDDVYAVHLGEGEAVPPGSLLTLNDGKIAVRRRGERELPAQGGLVTPVYSRGADGPLAVPTGQVFVRFREGVPAESRSGDLREAGYEIVRSPHYAPQTAWVRSHDGSPAQALANMERLQSLPDLEHVEPEMLMERASR